MCDPVSIASAVATVAGTAMQQRAQSRAQKGIESAIRNNGEANDRLRAESRTKVMDQTEQFNRDKFDRNQADETAKAKASFDRQISQGVLPGEYYGGAQSENTRRYSELKNNEAQSFSQQMSDALANLRGFDQAQGVNTRGIQRTSEVAGMNQNKEAGNNAILPLQIEAAKQKGSSLLGDILVGAGSAGLTAGLSGGGSGGLGAAFGGQGATSRWIAGMPANMQGPVPSFTLV